jgi:hypothetical protein
LAAPNGGYFGLESHSADHRAASHPKKPQPSIVPSQQQQQQSNQASSSNILMANNNASLAQAVAGLPQSKLSSSGAGGTGSVNTSQIAQTLYRTTNQLQADGGGGSTDKNAELIRLKKEYHQMMVRELQKKQQSIVNSGKSSHSQNNTVRFVVGSEPSQNPQQQPKIHLS